MKNIIKTLLVVTVLVLALVAFTGCGKCTHEGTTELIPSIIPTCTETGMTIGSKCTACGEIVLAPEVWEARGHDVTEIVETTADCLQGGVEKVYCDFCGDTYTREVEAYGHELVDVEATEPGCVEDGYTAHKACKHCDYTEGKESLGNLGGHVMEAVEENLAGCVNNPGYYAHNACSVCGHSDDIEYVEYTDDNPGHTFDPEEYFVAVSPTCTEDGLYAGYCLTCGKGYYLGYVPAAHVDEDGDFVCDVEGCGAHVNYDFAGGEGTAEAPYLIETAEQLANISKYYDTYKYYKVADGVETIDMTGVGKINLHGSFDGNGVKLVNLTTALFEWVGYENSVEEIKISNVDATMNNLDGRAFVRNIANAGTTTFENVHLHGYIEGLYNMGSFYNYGTTNCDGVGADYTVEFVGSTSDLTIVCTSGNIAGGFLGHSYEGAGNSFTMIIDANSAFTGKILTTTGKGNLYFAMTSDYYNANNKFVVAGEEITFNNGNIPAAANLGKITVAKPTAGESGYVVTPVEGATEFVVYLNAQVTAYDDEGYKIANKAGMTWPLGHFDLDTLAGYGLITSASIVNGADHDYGYEIVDGVLTIYSGRSANYASGTVSIQINQYDAEGNLLATGTLAVYVIEHPHTFVGGSCTTDGVCNCGAKQKALGHTGYESDYVCDTCSEIIAPAADSVLTIEQAIALGKAHTKDTYTVNKYYVSGTVKNVYNTSYGNMYITDGTNELCIYGTYSADGSLSYANMEQKPIAGDTITVYGIIGFYSSAQMKNGWVTEHSHEHAYSEATCTKAQTCACGSVVGEALGHTTENGTCERCGKTIGGTVESMDTTTYTFSSYTAGTQYAQGETHTLDSDTKLIINGAHLNTQVRLYAGSNAVIECNKTVEKITINAGNKKGTLNVYVSTDGNTWTLASAVSTTTTSYTDYEVSLGGSYQYIKLESPTGGAQIRVAKLTLN